MCRARWCHDMKRTSPASLLAETRAMLEAHPGWSEAKREAVQAQLNYLAGHAARTHFGEYRAKGWFIGSGVNDAGSKAVVARRLKQSGMFWSEAGAEDILGLRCLVLGPHFDAPWREKGASSPGNKPRPGDGHPTSKNAQLNLFVLHPPYLRNKRARVTNPAGACKKGSGGSSLRPRPPRGKLRTKPRPSSPISGAGKNGADTQSVSVVADHSLKRDNPGARAPRNGFRSPFPLSGLRKSSPVILPLQELPTYARADP